MKRSPYTRLQPIHARKRTGDTDTPANIRPPSYQSSLHDQIHRFPSRGPTRRKSPIPGVIRSAKNIVLRLAPHDALRQVGLCDHDSTEALEDLHDCRGGELGCVVDVADIADGGVDPKDVKLVFERYGEAVQRATLRRWKGVEFSCVGESAREEGFGESVCLVGGSCKPLLLILLRRTYQLVNDRGAFRRSVQNTGGGDIPLPIPNRIATQCHTV